MTIVLVCLLFLAVVALVKVGSLALRLWRWLRAAFARNQVSDRPSESRQTIRTGRHAEREEAMPATDFSRIPEVRDWRFADQSAALAAASISEANALRDSSTDHWQDSRISNDDFQAPHGAPEWTEINPATGLPMVGGIGGVDVAGNPFGTDLRQHDSIDPNFNHDSGGFGSSDAGVRWDD